MNNIQALTDSITKQAQLEADSYLNEEHEKINQEKESSESGLEARFAEKKQQLEALSSERIKTAQTRKKSMIHKESTRYKQSLMEKLFDEVYGELCDMSPEEFIGYFKKTILSAGLQGTYTVRVGEKSAVRFTDTSWTALNIKTDACEISADKNTIAGEGGFVLVQSALEYSFLFRDQLQEIKHRSGSGILKQLLD